MAKSTETFNKKEKEKKRLKKQQEKKEKAEMRKSNSDKGKDLDDMMAYIDENGDITTVKPTGIRTNAKVDLDDIQIAIPKRIYNPEDDISSGIISFFNTDKGYGFIRDSKTQQNVFFHINALTYQAKENDKVTFTVEKGPKGLNAVGVKKL